MQEQIVVEKLCREYAKRTEAKGLRKIWPKKKLVKALDKMSFSIKPGEIVGYIGANGSGKSTTLKILTGVLWPTTGAVNVMGFVPWRDRKEYTKHIGVVFGQKSLLWWDLAAEESFKLYRDIYEVPLRQYEERMRYFNKLLNISEIMKTQVRKMSFGERMRCELVAALLHKPKIVFLDEPTIGMDVVAKEQVRKFLLEINRKEGTTIIITTHDLGDIEALCDRVLIVDHGVKIYDGDLETLKKKYVTEKEVNIVFSSVRDAKLLKRTLAKCTILSKDEDFLTVRINIKKHNAAEVIEKLIKSLSVVDMSVYEPELDEIVRKIYHEGAVR